MIEITACIITSLYLACSNQVLSSLTILLSGIYKFVNRFKRSKSKKKKVRRVKRKEKSKYDVKLFLKVLCILLSLTACADILYISNVISKDVKSCETRVYRTLTFDKPITRSELVLASRHKLPSVLHLKNENLSFTDLKIDNIEDLPSILKEINVYIYTYDVDKLKRKVYLIDLQQSYSKSVKIEVLSK